MIEIHLRRARRKVCDASISFTVCGRENLRCVYACLPPGGGKCGDPTLSNRKSAVLMAPRFLLLGKNSV